MLKHSILPPMLSFLFFANLLLEKKMRLLPHAYRLHLVLKVKLLKYDFFFSEPISSCGILVEISRGPTEPTASQLGTNTPGIMILNQQMANLRYWVAEANNAAVNFFTSISLISYSQQFSLTTERDKFCSLESNHRYCNQTQLNQRIKILNSSPFKWKGPCNCAVFIRLSDVSLPPKMQSALCVSTVAEQNQ